MIKCFSDLEPRPFSLYKNETTVAELIGGEYSDLEERTWNGLFFISTDHKNLMARIRVPGGRLKSNQLRAIGNIARELTTGYIQITTRCNFQIRFIKPKDAREGKTEESGSRGSRGSPGSGGLPPPVERSAPVAPSVQVGPQALVARVKELEEEIDEHEHDVTLAVAAEALRGAPALLRACSVMAAEHRTSCP